MYQIPFTVPMMCDSDKANLARGYLDRRSSDKVPTEGMLLWLDSRGTISEELCYSKHEEKAGEEVALKEKFVVVSPDSHGYFFRSNEGLALLKDINSAKTIFTVHSDDPDVRGTGERGGGDYYRRNGGRLVRRLDRGREGVGEAIGEALKITCRVVVVCGTMNPEWAVTREMIIYGRLLKYEEIVDVESYLREQWKVKLRDVPEYEALLDAKRVDFFTTFYQSTKVIHNVRLIFASLTSPQHVTQLPQRLAILEQYNILSEVEDTATRLALPKDISRLDFICLMGEVKVLADVAGVMWEEYAGTNGTIPKDDLMSLLGLNPALKAAVKTSFEKDPGLMVRPVPPY